MKRLLFLCLMMSSVQVWAWNFVVDGIYYNIVARHDATCEVTYQQFDTATPTYTGELVIPATVVVEDGSTWTVVGIGSDAFDHCTFTSISLPETIEYIGEWAFYDCVNMTEITIPDAVTSIGIEAFDNCDGLTTITIPNNVTKMETQVFYDCDGLKEVTLGTGMADIGLNVFGACLYIEKMTILNPTPPEITGHNPWSPRINCVLYVPAGSKSAYEEYSTIIYSLTVGPETYTQYFQDIVEIDVDGIDSPLRADATVSDYYTLGGQKISTLQRGITIVRYSDGTTKKIATP